MACRFVGVAVWGINGLGLIQFIGLRVHNSSYDRPDIKPQTLNSHKPDLATRLLFTVRGVKLFDSAERPRPQLEEAVVAVVV